MKVITSLPNTNIADAVGRLPSVSLERDEGRGQVHPDSAAPNHVLKQRDHQRHSRTVAGRRAQT